MSTKYKHGDHVPTSVLCARANELVSAITAKDYGASLKREFTMRIPAELDRDADLVISELSSRVLQHEARINVLERQLAECDPATVTVSREDLDRVTRLAALRLESRGCDGEGTTSGRAVNRLRAALETDQ